jgi:hypothetical protein
MIPRNDLLAIVQRGPGSETDERLQEVVNSARMQFRKGAGTVDDMTLAGADAFEAELVRRRAAHREQVAAVEREQERAIAEEAREAAERGAQQRHDDAQSQTWRRHEEAISAAEENAKNALAVAAGSRFIAFFSLGLAAVAIILRACEK